MAIMALQLNYAANSYITVTLEQPNLELASLLKEAPAGISDVGSLGPGDMASTRVLCLNGVPSSDQPALEAKRASSFQGARFLLTRWRLSSYKNGFLPGQASPTSP
jgi:hypothetical protein